jgi:transposase
VDTRFGRYLLPSHRSRRMLDWLADRRAWLSAERLPGYAPDLNPIEQVWGNVKSHELANLCADSIGPCAAQRAMMTDAPARS